MKVLTLFDPKKTTGGKMFTSGGVVFELWPIENPENSVGVFFVIFFSKFVLHQCIHRDHTPRRFSIDHFLLCESLKKGP